MNIWFDLCNSPHVSFFSEMIHALERNHNVFITCRPLSNTIELLDIHKLNYRIVGSHYGRNILKKVVGLPIRVVQLYRYLKDLQIDAAVSHSSFYSPIVARMLGAYCIYLNDNEHADGNRISFIFADRIMIPEFLSFKKIRKQGASRSKLVYYPGVKEGVYLWNFKSNGSTEKNNGKKRKQIFIRPEPNTAQYYNGKHNHIDTLLLGLKDKYDITILPRNDEQHQIYKRFKYAGVRVAEQTIPLLSITSTCDLFVGAGGTMTREAAVLGIPTISIYQDKLLDVDRFLISQGCMVHNQKPTPEYIEQFLNTSSKKPPNIKLLQKGRQAFQLIMNTLLKSDGVYKTL